MRHAPSDDARRRALRASLLTLLLLAGSVRAAEDPRVARGRYITHDVAMCVECHSPRTEDGRIIREQEFTGGSFPVGPPTWVRDGKWCVRTPHIAGLPGWETEEAIQFLMNGARMGRHQPKDPMPPFHLNREDAEAVVAYLRSIGGSAPGQGGGAGSGEKPGGPTNAQPPAAGATP
jgi:mono/diheme cytochrome c family protein